MHNSVPYNILYHIFSSYFLIIFSFFQFCFPFVLLPSAPWRLAGQRRGIWWPAASDPTAGAFSLSLSHCVALLLCLFALPPALLLCLFALPSYHLVTFVIEALPWHHQYRSPDIEDTAFLWLISFNYCTASTVFCVQGCGCINLRSGVALPFIRIRWRAPAERRASVWSHFKPLPRHTDSFYFIHTYSKLTTSIPELNSSRATMLKVETISPASLQSEQ